MARCETRNMRNHFYCKVTKRLEDGALVQCFFSKKKVQKLSARYAEALCGFLDHVNQVLVALHYFEACYLHRPTGNFLVQQFLGRS